MDTWTENMHELVYMGVFYLAGLWILLKLRSNKEPMKLRSFKLIYNLVMAIFSFYIFYGVLEKLSENFLNSKTNTLVCDGNLELFKGMEPYFRIFYYSKYIEFIDTFLLIMGGATISSVKMYLHVYHHLVTPSIVYFSWFYPCTGGWVGPLSNGFVHTLMYAYYGFSVLDPRCKKYGNMVTYVQLVQFISVLIYYLGIIVPAYFTCTGSCNMKQVVYNLAQYGVFLVLFLLFFRKKNKGTKQNAVTQNGAVDKKIE